MSTAYRVGCHACWRAAVDGSDLASDPRDARWCMSHEGGATAGPEDVHDLIERREAVLVVDELTTFGRDRRTGTTFSGARYFGRLSSGWSGSAGRLGIVGWDEHDWWESTCEFLRAHEGHRLCSVSEYGDVEVERPEKKS